MKGYRKIMKAVAVILAFALIFSGMNESIYFETGSMPPSR